MDNNTEMQQIKALFIGGISFLLLIPAAIFTFFVALMVWAIATA